VQKLAERLQKDYDEVTEFVTTTVGVWGSGYDPFGNQNRAGMKQLKELEEKSKAAAQKVGQAFTAQRSGCSTV
jgi:hypothetical protein